MPSNEVIPTSNSLGLTVRQARKLQRQEVSAALDVQQHRRHVRKLAACAEAEIEAVADVNRAAATEEMNLVDEMLPHAAGSRLKSRSVARALQRQEVLADRIIRRTFGG